MNLLPIPRVTLDNILVIFGEGQVGLNLNFKGSPVALLSISRLSGSNDMTILCCSCAAAASVAVQTGDLAAYVLSVCRQASLHALAALCQSHVSPSFPSLKYIQQAVQFSEAPALISSDNPVSQRSHVPVLLCSPTKVPFQ